MPKNNKTATIWKNVLDATNTKHQRNGKGAAQCETKKQQRNSDQGKMLQQRAAAKMKQAGSKQSDFVIRQE